MACFVESKINLNKLLAIVITVSLLRISCSRLTASFHTQSLDVIKWQSTQIPKVSISKKTWPGKLGRGELETESYQNCEAQSSRNQATNEKSIYTEENENATPYEEVSLDEMDYDDIDDCFYYPCPCGDRFVLSSSEYAAGSRIATCPSCSLVLKVT